MLHFFKFADAVPAPVPSRAAYLQRGEGKGWPEECPPLRAASAFGWDVLAAFDMHFVQKSGRWSLENPVEIESDWAFSSAGEDGEETESAPPRQLDAWFWDPDHALPHPISAEVYRQISNQVKVSTFLFLRTDPNELLYMTDIPNLHRPFRALTALVDTDWYPASYPWHCVLELNRDETDIRISAGEPVCRLFTVRRDSYFAREMTPEEFGNFFERSQEWLRRHGKGEPSTMMDITGSYGRQQRLSRFSVII